MRIQHGRCPRVGFSYDRHFSHDRPMRDVTGRCSAKIQRCVPGRRWRRRRRSKLRFVLNERRWCAGRKRREDRNNRSQRDEWARQWPRPDRDHGCKTITTDDAPTAHRHTPPPTVPNPPGDRGRTAAAISLVQGRLRNCLGVMVLPHRGVLPKNMLKFNRAGPKGPISHSSVVGLLAKSSLNACVQFDAGTVSLK